LFPACSWLAITTTAALGCAFCAQIFYKILMGDFDPDVEPKEQQQQQQQQEALSSKQQQQQQQQHAQQQPLQERKE
jgi:transcription initiation factor TFIID subunit TAF12